MAWLASKPLVTKKTTESVIWENFCNSFTGWIDQDAVNGTTSLATQAGEPVFDMDSNSPPAVGNFAGQRYDDAAFATVPDSFVIKYRVWPVLLGTPANGDQSVLTLFFGPNRLVIALGDVYYRYTGSAYADIGIGAVPTGAFLDIKLVVNSMTGNDVDVWVDEVERATSVPMFYSGTSLSLVTLRQNGFTTADRQSFVSHIRVLNI